jgi:S-adenosylmethionine:tRNA ribosyltransferase-isomerase
MNGFDQVSINPGLHSLDFDLPPELEASEPPEERGLSRDGVRLLVSYIDENRVEYARFRNLAGYLAPGDVLVVNTSGTLQAALAVRRAGGDPLELHLSTRLPAELWVVELREPAPGGSLPFYDARPGEKIDLPGAGVAHLLTPYRADQRYSLVEGDPVEARRVRLWIASLRLPCPAEEYLACYGFPIRYKYVREGWPISYYQTVYASEMGSAEMPSAGRAFTTKLLDELEARRVKVVPVLLHTGVASLESHEPPYEEFYRVPVETARTVNQARAKGGRVIAVGTTSVRALETASEEDGTVHPGEGWTRLVITPERGLHSVDGLLTGFHEPRSTHLAMLEALAGEEHLRLTYAEALYGRYLWHEFGDLHLILP